MTDSLDTAVLEELVEVMGGSTEIVEDIIATYVSETPPLVEAIAAMADVDEVRNAAHTLKSSSRAVGAAIVGDTAEQIETAARDGEIDSVAEACAATPAQFEQACNALTAWLAAQSG